MVYAGTSYFGEFAKNEIVTEVKKRHFNKALLISDAALDACGVVSKIKKVLDDADIPYEIDLDVKPNPTIENVHAGLLLLKKSGADFIIAVGGGSVIDTSKAVAVIAANPENEDVVSLEGMDKSTNVPLPLLAVPTTAGTGSETTMDYVITNTEEKRKMACMDSLVVPVAAFLDTEIMATLPLKLTAATAMDALTHALESYISKGAFSFSETLSLKAVSLISENFLKVLESPDNYDVRKELAIAQFMAGMSFTNVGLGIVHSMAHPLSAFYDVPHGIANALILPYIVKFNADACPDKMIELALTMDKNFDKTSDYKDAAEFVSSKITAFNKAASLPLTLSEINAKKEDINDLAKSALEDAATPDNPKDVSLEDFINLYTSMF